MHVLVAEDEGFSRLLLEKLLKQLEFQVTTVDSGQKAFELLRDPKGPRLALLDWHLPDMEGPEICQRIRQLTLPYRFMLLLTAKTGTQHMKKAFEKGADSFIEKPFEMEFLAAKLLSVKRQLGHMMQLETLNPVATE